MTLWLSADATDAWRPSPSGRPGAPKRFSDCAIETALTLRLVSAAPASAQQWSRTTTGAVTLSAGVGLVFAAFDFTFDVCPEGYSTHTYQNQPTQCLYVSPSPPFDTDVRDATPAATLSHPKLAWTGIGAIALGAVLLAWPDNRVTRDIDVQVSPERVEVRRRFGW